TIIPTKKNKKTIDKEAEKVVQASTSSDISKKRYFKRQIYKYKLRYSLLILCDCNCDATGINFASGNRKGHQEMLEQIFPINFFIGNKKV
ncbi:hypothetical protein BpHYR1_037034, partial [Brachionus plicatilis]